MPLMAKTMEGMKRAQVPARSRATRWRIGVLILVHVLFAIHLAHYMTTGRTVSPLEPSEAMEFAKRSAINAGFVLFALATASTLVLGRFFCGWACHLVALQDLCRGILLKLGIRPRPLRSRALALVPFLAAGYMFFYPLIVRWWTHADDLSVHTQLQTDSFWATFPTLVTALLTLFVAGFVMVFFLGSKGFCTYACPYGALFGVADKLSPGRIRVTDACEGCHHCTQACTSNVDVGREVHEFGMVVDPGCMKCMDGVSVGPTDALYFGLGRPALGAKPRAPFKRKRPRMPWLEEVLLAGLAILSFFAFRGLYGRVPFLLALALATSSGFLVLRSLQLITKPKLRLVGWDLKQAGKLTGRGKLFAGLSILGSALLLHCVAVQVIGYRSTSAFDTLREARANWFMFQRTALTQDQIAAANRVQELTTQALSWGLLEDARRYEQRGWARVMLGQDEEGRADLRSARRVAPRISNLSIELGHLARSTGDLDGAFDNYVSGLLAFPANMDIRRYLIDVAVERRDPAPALEALLGISDKRKWDGPLWDQIGTLRLATGDALGARRDLAHALELLPENTQVRGKLVQLWQAEAGAQAAAGQPSAAHQAAKQALSLLPDNAALSAWAKQYVQ
ncbi:MAG: ferredoxin [Planctomycetota bacterium]|jgi:ferredoxin